MIFNLASIVLAASALVGASPSLSKRGETSCVISVSGFPFPVTDPLPSGASVTAEWTTCQCSPILGVSIDPETDLNASDIEQLFTESATPVRVRRRLLAFESSSPHHLLVTSRFRPQLSMALPAKTSTQSPRPSAAPALQMLKLRRLLRAGRGGLSSASHLPT